MAMSTTTFPVIAVFGTALLIAPSSPPPAAAARLTPRELQTISAASWAYFHGDSQAVLEKLSPIVAKANDEKIGLVDKALAEQGAPGSERLLFGARMALLQQSIDTKKLPKPGERETVRLLRMLGEQVEGVLTQVEKNPAQDRSAADIEDLEEFDSRLWSLHVAENRLAAADRLVESMKEFSRSFPRGQIAKLSADDRRIVTADHKALGDRVAEASRARQEREIEVRINRLHLARRILENPELTNERFMAAFTADLDARLIRDYFEQTKKQGRAPASERLKDSQTANQISDDSARARKLAGSLTAKAQLFFEGLHWWMRGRYGLGPEVGGLAKSRAALRSAAGQFALAMPETTPSPRDPAWVTESEGVPRFERRHHYLWAWEDRRLYMTSDGLKAQKIADGPTFTITGSRFW
jgi:hypothetical protein